MPTEEGQDLIDLTREICDKELRPKVDAAERAAATDESFPTEVFRTLGAAGLLSLPHPEEFGGYGQPYEVYLQVVEEIASAWMSVAVGVSVHSLTAYPVTTFGTPEQQAALLPGMLSGEQLGAYCLSEPLAGSDVGSMTTRAVGEGDADGEPTATGCAAARPGSATPATPTTTRPSPARATTAGAGCPASSCRPTPPASRSAPPRRRWGCTATPCAR